MRECAGAEGPGTRNFDERGLPQALKNGIEC